MAYPGESENVEYMKYLERHDLGEEEGPRMSKEEWRKKRQQEQQQQDRSSTSPTPVRSTIMNP